MLGIAGAHLALFNVGSVMDQDEAGARALAQPTSACRDSWTGPRPRDGILVQYFAYNRDLGVSSIEVVYTIMAQ